MDLKRRGKARASSGSLDFRNLRQQSNYWIVLRGLGLWSHFDPSWLSWTKWIHRLVFVETWFCRACEIWPLWMNPTIGKSAAQQRVSSKHRCLEPCVAVVALRCSLTNARSTAWPRHESANVVGWFKWLGMVKTTFEMDGIVPTDSAVEDGVRLKMFEDPVVYPRFWTDRDIK